MHNPRLIVLKFGGSVLRNDTDLTRVVHEIYRWRRDGWNVVAVVSALHGQTDALLRTCRTVVDDPSPCATAAHVANGELHAASLLGLRLDRAGVPAVVLHPAAVQLVADGDPLDAQALSVDQRLVLRAIDQTGVVVLPGFVATDRHGRTVLLGRGGSDLSALFLAQRLGAQRCRLIKDVDGLYERDPREAGRDAPRRYDHATWADALSTDGSIVQHKAVCFGREAGIAFELGSVNDSRPTRIGSPATRLSTASTRRPLRVALLGLGTVGGGVWQHLRIQRELFDVRAVAVRRTNLRRDVQVPATLLTDDALAAATSGVDIVIELIGGTTVARSCVEAAIESGAHVVTANKALLAEHGAALRAEAVNRNVELRCAASIGGSMPIIEHAVQSSDPGIQVRGVFNGTCNFILERCSEGATFDDAIADAQQRGFCERDPSRDLDGRDTADKLCVLAERLVGVSVDVEDIPREVVASEHAERARRCAAANRRLRQVAMLKCTAEGVELRVELRAIEPGDPLFDVHGARNRAVICRASGTIEIVNGRGAGRWPTAEAVMADVLALERESRWMRQGDASPAMQDAGATGQTSSSAWPMMQR